MNSCVLEALKSRSILLGVDPTAAGFAGSIPTLYWYSFSSTSPGWTRRSPFASFQL
jgi:hypothetical protein